MKSIKNQTKNNPPLITTEQIIGDVIFISFQNSERYIDFGINKNCGHFLVKGYDSFGIWVEHPGITIKHTEDSTGKPIPTKKMFTENIDANFLVTWDNIKSIMHYPGREGFDFPSEFDKHIGFSLNNKEK